MNKRYFFYDVLKGLATLAVLGIHVAYFYLGNPFGSIEHKGAIFVNNILRFGVPFFFIISGLLLASPKKGESWKNFYLKKLKRIFLPYLVISLIVFAFIQPPFKQSLWLLLTGDTLEPYYFFIVLLQLYFLYPVLRHVKTSLAVQLFVVIGTLLGTILGLNRLYGIPFFLPYMGYFAFGILFSERLKERAWSFGLKKLALAVIILHLIFFAFFPIYWYNMGSIYSSACFILLSSSRNFWEQKTSLNTMLAWVGKRSLWYYFYHFTIVQGFYLLIIPLIDPSLWGVSMMIIFFLSFFVTTGLTWVTEKLFFRTKFN